MDRDLDQLFTTLADRADLPTPTDAEIAAALDLARVVARGVVRRGAPLVCYAAGLALGRDTAPEERARRLRVLIAEAEAMAAADPAPDVGTGAPDADG